MFDEELAELVKWKHNHAVRIVRRKMLCGCACNESSIWLAPGHSLELEAALLHVVEDAGAVELVRCWRGIVCCARLVADFCVGVEEVDFDALF
jgi:hypothetical protein